jgi:electron transfer flavoprotein beta subunit
MKVLVPVKQVASLDEDFTLDGAPDGPAAVPAEALHWKLNEWDGFSLEAALELAEGAQGSEVVVATVGDERAEEGLLACLAMGADRAIRLWDEAFTGADALAVANVLAALAAAETPDLILCGVQSADAASAATGVALAGLLDLPRVAVVNAIERDGDRLTVQRELEGGAIEVLRVTLPAVLTVQSGINQPRKPTLRAIKQARGKPPMVLAPADIGLDTPGAPGALAGAGSRTVRLREPARGGATMLEGAPEEIAARVSELVGEALRG